MCGIVGGIAERPVYPILIEGLKHLEYRGYDSAGIALLNRNHDLTRWRVTGKVSNLEQEINSHPSEKLGIAHTRWATHGAPTQCNAHPHLSSDRYAIVHNGIIENYQTLKADLTQLGYHFSSETDSEVIAHLIHHHNKDNDPFSALKKTCDDLTGAYAICCIDRMSPDKLYAVRRGSPLVLGLGIGENFIASDALALLPVTQKIIYLHEGDLVQLSKNQVDIRDEHFRPVQRQIQHTTLTTDTIDKAEYRHHMLKEIFQQPTVATDTIKLFQTPTPFPFHAFGQRANSLLPRVKRIQIVACGTSYHAGLVAQHWLESIAQIPTQVDIASEHRYRPRIVEQDTLFIALSQSGETADTLAALRNAPQAGYLATLGICNVASSSLAREADLVFITRAGIEIGVAATKTFTAQLIALLGLAATLAPRENNHETQHSIWHTLSRLPGHIQAALKMNSTLQGIAADFINKNHAIFLGRGIHYPIAMEGALKLKEISYIHAESYAAGELKHGPLALIDNEMPVVAVAPPCHLIHKMISNIKEVEARGGQLLIFTHHSIELEDKMHCQQVHLDQVDPVISPIVYNLPLQLLAYHIAVFKGTDIDQPRNLAKSVTVE